MPTYIKKLAKLLKANMRTSQSVLSVKRSRQGVIVTTRNAQNTFDQVVFATHADQALALLVKPSERKQTLLSQFKYVAVENVAHQDTAAIAQKN
ncbi:FAD-dependent oxidoreductase [Bartonella sp. DGB2]|uniref:FAD-dependent oxidoreductase n=1 Tax=Bartonella sp. DGB2 TaxID=3388426 RepID=UPI0039900470